MGRRWFVVVVLGLLSILSIPVEAALRVGVAKVDITPGKPVTMAGYGSRKDLSTSIHDPLAARALVFEVDGDRLVLVSTDILGFYEGTARDFREAILSQFDLEPGQLFLSAIHTHSAPSPVLDPKRGHANNIEYTNALRGKLVDLVRQAIEDLQPAEIGIGVGHCPVGSNRRQLRVRSDGQTDIVLGRNPYGPSDKEVLVMKVTKPGGELRAVAFDYATHATSLGPKNYAISGDVIGLAEQFVEKVLGTETVAPAFVGASGDIDPWFRVLPGFDTERGWIPEPVLLGTFLGEEVVHVCRRIDRTVSADRVTGAFASVKLPGKAGVNVSVDPDPGPLNVTVARLGDVAFVGLGGEVLTDIGLAIKAGSPCKHTFIITHCNGAAGYLAPANLHVQGGYEVRTSKYAPQAAEKLVRRSITMLHDL